VTALVVGLGFFSAQQASANWGMNRGACMGSGNLRGEPCYAQLDAATKVKADKFYSETVELRKQIVMKNAEEHAVMSSDNPDPVKAAKLAGEMFDLRTAMHAKVEAAGLSALYHCVDGAGYDHAMGPRDRAGRNIRNDNRDGRANGPAVAAPVAPARVDAK
jgi:zinc resistance-associated protein